VSGVTIGEERRGSGLVEHPKPLVGQNRSDFIRERPVNYSFSNSNSTISKGGIMDEKMKKFIPLFVLIGLAIVAVAIYIIVYHVGMPTRDLSGAPANFWLGLWQGLIVFLSFIASWFDNNIVLYQVNNNGFWYNLGYIIALFVSIGAFAGGSREAGKESKKEAKKEITKEIEKEITKEL
jgi:hypothetical protein